jgi:hypothetical protein
MEISTPDLVLRAVIGHLTPDLVLRAVIGHLSVSGKGSRFG